MKYLSLDAIADLSSDSSVFETSKKRSITFEDDVVSLYGFGAAAAGVTLELSPAEGKSHLEDGYHVLVRHKDGDSFSLMYAYLSATFMDGDGSSVEKVPDDPAKFQLLDWTSHTATEVTDPGSREFLTKNGSGLEYVTLKLSAESGSSYFSDSEKVDNSKSLSRTELGGESEEDAGSYFSVAGFATQANEDKSTLEASPENYSVLLRKKTGSDVKEMAYAALADLAGSSVNTNWNWPKDDDGKWKEAGTFWMTGYYLFGCSLRKVDALVPSGSGFLVLEINYGKPASYPSYPQPASETLKWTSSPSTTFSLETVQVPLWQVSGDTRVQWCSSVFSVPVYS